MPWIRKGKTVYKRMDGKLKKKQTAKSLRNAHIIMSNLKKLEKNPKAKVFGEAKRSKTKKLKISR